jgi:hypothetical protein
MRVRYGALAAGTRALARLREPTARSAVSGVRGETGGNQQ